LTGVTKCLKFKDEKEKTPASYVGMMAFFGK
jgi:hypothetical protein